MKLNEDQQAKIRSHLASMPNSAEWKCSFCNSSIWSVLDRIYELREFNEGALTLGGTLIPLISLICDKCGNTIFFNAYQLGLIDKKSENSGHK